MLSRLSGKFRRPNHATVVAYLGLFVALGGTGAYAANTIRSSDIVDGEILSADVKDQSLTTFDVSTFLGADVVDGTLTGADIQDSSVQFNDIGTEAIGSDEVTNNSLLQSDLRSGSVAGDEIADNSVASADIRDFSVAYNDLAGSAVDSQVVLDGALNDEDISETLAIDFIGAIGVVPATACVYRDVSGLPNIGGDHLLLTPNTTDADQYLVYSAEYRPDGNDSMRIKVCNFFHTQIDDGNTHFNLLAIDAQ
jgi:hypothetical protein